MAKGNQVAAKELRERGDAELKSLLAAKIEELHKARFKHALGQLRTTHTLLGLRREVARIETVLRERSRAAAAPKEVSHG
jgi:large subunit ribosomal protein L29